MSYFFRPPPRFWPRRTFKYLRPILPTPPTISAAFWADFSTTTTLPSQFTFSRASSGMYVNSSGVLSTASSNVPRFNYDRASLALRGLLLEGQATNLLVPTDITDTSWVAPDVQPKTTGATGPDGVASCRMIEGSTNNGWGLQRGASGSGSLGVWTAVAYFRSRFYDGVGSKRWCLLSAEASGGICASFDPETLTIGALGSNNNGGVGTWIYATISDFGGGWRRCAVTSNNSFGNFCVVAMSDQAVPPNWQSRGNANYLGDGVSGVDVTMPFVFNGFDPGSHIATTTAVVTRSADLLSTTDATLLALNGWAIEVDDVPIRSTATLLGVNTVVGIGFDSTGALTTAIGGTQTSGNVTNVTNSNRGAVAWDSTPRVSISLDNGTVVTAANTPITPTTLYFGNTNNGASGFLNGHLIKLGGYTTVSDVELQRISNVGASFTGPAAGPSNATLNVSPTSDATGTLSIVATSSFNATVVSTAIGNLNIQATGSLGVSPVIAAAGNFSATASAALAVTMASTALGRLSINAAATLSTATAINTTGLLNIQASGSLAVHPVIADTGLLNINTSSALAATMGIAAIGGLTFTNTITLTAATGEAASAQAAQFGQIWIGANFDFVGPSVGAWNPAISDSTIVFTSSNRIATKPTAGTTGHRRVLGDTPRTDTTGTYFFTVDTLGPWGQIAVGLADSSEVLIDPVIGTTTHSVVFSYSGFIQGPGSFVGGDSQYFYGITGGRANNRIGTLWDPANSSVSFYLWYDNAWHFVGTSTGVSFSPCYPTLDLWSINDSTLVDFSPMNRPAGASPWNARQTGAVANLSVNTSATLSTATGTSSTGLLNMQAAGSLAVHPAIADAGNLNIQAAATVATTLSISPLGNLNIQAAAALATTAAISAIGGLSFISTISLAVASAETPVGRLSVLGSVSVPVTSTETPAGSLAAFGAAGMAYTSGISNTGTGALGGQFSMTFSNGLAMVGGFTFLGSVTIGTTAGLSASMLASLIGRSSLAVATTETASSIATLLGAASLSVSPVEAAAATAILIGNASLSVATAEIASSIATLIASATLSVAPVETPLGNLNISTAATLAAVNAITTAGFLSFLKTISTNVAPVSSDAANLSIQTTLGFAATAGSTNTGTGALGAQYSMTFSPGILASTGNLFISSITFAATAAILSSVTASLVGAGTFSVHPVETPAGNLNMTAAASLAQTETISAIAQDLMNMAVSFAVHPVETASLPAPTYQGDIALAVATALASTSKLDARNSSAFASTMSELAASTAFMTSASSLAQSLVETVLGGLSVSASASFAAHPASANVAALTVTGTIAANIGTGGATSSSATLRPLLIYSAVFGQESANRLTASDAITLATRAAISVVLESDHPSVAVIAARGVWSDVVNVSGVYSDTETLEGVMRLTIELAGVENALN